MLRTIAGAVAPALLLIVALLDWSLISLLFLIAFLIMQYGNAQRGVNLQSGNMIWLIVIILSVIGIIAEIGFYVAWSVRTEEWKVAKLLWAKLFGLYRLNPWEGGYFIYILITLQVLLILVASMALYAHGTQPSSEVSSVRGSIYQLKNCCGLLLPLVQLVVGVSYPCWIALPFFLGCCCELLKWCFTSSIFDLPWCKRTLQSYAALNILLLYVYQLPVDVSPKLSFVADYVGLFKVTRGIGWSEAIFGSSVILFFIMLCSEKENVCKTTYSRVESHSFFASNGLTEELLPSHSSLSCSMYIPLLNVPPVREISFQRIVINFFVFGIPVSVLFLSIWSFTFPSLCAFILIIYCEYVISSSLSLRMFNRLNVLLLSFILVWSLCKYIFYSTTKVSGDVIKKDLNIWYMIGLYDHSIPGLLLFIQYCLAVLFTFSIISCKYITGYLNTAKKDEFKDESDIEEGQRKIALAIALIAWCLRKTSRPVAVVLVFTLGLKPGLLHAVYMTFFLIYLLKSTVGKRVRQSLVLISALHFALLYLLRLSLITDVLGHKGEKVKGILLQLGLSEDTSLWEFLGIALLLCFSSIQDHGTGLLFSLNKILQRFPQSPFNFVFMRGDFWQMVLLTIYSSDDFVDTYPTIMLEGNLIAKYLSSIGQKCQKAYRCCGAYIVFLTILFTVYMVDPNYLSFGYLFFLLLWIIGRQLVERTRRRLWMPLMIYSILSFIVIYMTSSFPFFWSWIPMKEIIFSYMGFDPHASTFKNLWDAAAVLVVMQLYRYEREQVFIDPSHNDSYDNDKVHNKILGFLKRFIIWHSGKMLTVSIFYASITPVSVCGFAYLISMIVLSNFPKATPLPAKIYATYTGMLIASDYLFQILGGQLQMFPGQKYADISGWLGFQIFEKGFWGIESGLRSKILVIIACAVQYNVFRWLELMPASLVTRERWAEPCRLFVCHENNAEKSSQEEAPLLQTEIQAKTILQHQAVVDTNHDTASMDSTPRGSLFYSFWGSTKESQRWNRKVLLCLKKERYEAQLRSLKLYAKFWTENLFNLFGLEINMLTLLLASFTVLNSVSLLYVSILCLCILLNRRKLHCMWPFYVVLFACILTFEYIALANAFAPWSHKGNRKMRCHDCWNSSVALYSYCTRCWFGVVVDDRQMLVTYFLVFFVATFKLRGNLSGGYTDSDSYHRLYSEKSDRLVWKEISFETKGQWTWLDHFRLFFYRHLLDVVLMLVLITGTLEYDILHLGYLAFAMVAFRARDGILKRKNRIFKYLRIYNFVLIVLSLAFQAPFFGDVENRKCSMPDSLYGAIGFYKYDYGFRITSRSALIDIIIFCLVGLQSYIFRSRAFGQVIKYLEAEQIDAILNAQEKRAAWKTKQLQHIREIEDRKKKRRMQVEKMKTEMNNIQGLTMRSPSNPSNEDYSLHDLDRSRKNANSNPVGSDNSNNQFRQRPLRIHEVPPDTFPLSETVGNEGIKKKCDAFPNEISEFKESSNRKNIAAETTSYQTEEKAQEAREKRFATAVQLIGNGVAQVHSLGNQAMANLVNFFNIEKSEFDDNELSPNQEDVIADQSIEEKGDILQHPEEISSASQATEHVTAIGKWQWFYKLFCYCWSRVRNNIDSICYCCFVLVFLWNFSLLAMVYLVALFLYALLVNPGPGSLFWITMLIYTELIILFQYLYQISANHCGPHFNSEFQRKIGFSATSENSSFVVSVLPLFTVYLFTLVQCSVKIKDSEWMSVSEYGFLHRRPFQQKGNEKVHWKENIWSLLQSIVSGFQMIGRSLKRYWQSLTYGSESPPHFVQVSMHITVWPEDGIQPERIESSINRVLDTYHRRHCNQTISATHSVSRVRVESIERSPDDSNVALAVFEVIYASSLIACPAHDHYFALKPAADVASELLSAKESGIFDEICFPYPVVSVIAGGKREIDFYAFIFCADLVAFFLVGIFYQSMIKHNNEFLDVYQLEDQFPKEFVFVLMILFFLIVVDRIIYLWSFGWGKVIYYFFSLVLFTYSVTLYAWNMEAKGQFKGELALRAFYLTKAVSLTLEALQIKFGLPHKSALYGQFLTRRITNANFLGFRIYRALPFLYELRCVLDWSCTATALTMYDWLKLEDIYASLYLVKCDITLSRAKHQLGEKQSKTTKFWSGICLFLILICVIWTPMLMYSSGNPTNIANPVTAVMTQIDVNTQGGRLTLYQNSMCHCFPWDELLANGYNLDPQGYLKTYDSKDLQLICCEADANSYWMVPSSALKRFMISVNKDTSIIFSWEFTRARPKGKEVAKYNPIDPVFPYGLQEVLNGTSNVVQLSSIYPRYLRLTGSGEVHRLEQTDDVYGINGSLFLNRSPQPWWSFHEENSPEGCRELRGPSSIVFSEETPQGFIGETLSKFSIWSLYITFVLAVGRFIRLQCSDLRMRIPYENFPSCDRLIAICEDIYAARAAGELVLEELLFITLVDIYRSPHVLIEYTKED